MDNSSSLTIALILPDLLGTYGDNGNAIIVEQRAQKRGIKTQIHNITINDTIPEHVDIFLMGGAEDNAQQLATQYLKNNPNFIRSIQNGTPLLAVCASIQILGTWWQTQDQVKHPGIELFDLTTTPMQHRAIGEILTQPSDQTTKTLGIAETLTGFENHRGGTHLGADTQPFAITTNGVGNDTAPSRYEGVINGNAIGTYMHGPVLARNPELADALIAKATGLNITELEPISIPAVDQLRNERIIAGKSRSKNPDKALKPIRV